MASNRSPINLAGTPVAGLQRVLVRNDRQRELPGVFLVERADQGVRTGHGRDALADDGVAAPV
jgi:hypothetical protein